MIGVVDLNRRRQGSLGKFGHYGEETPVPRLLAQVRISPDQRRRVTGLHLTHPHDIPGTERDHLRPTRCGHHRIPFRRLTATSAVGATLAAN